MQFLSKDARATMGAQFKQNPDWKVKPLEICALSVALRYSGWPFQVRPDDRSIHRQLIPPGTALAPHHGRSLPAGQSS